MTVRIIGISQDEQDIAIRYAKCDESEFSFMESIEGEMAVETVSRKVGMKMEDCKRWLAATFMVLLSLTNCFDSAETERVFRVRRREQSALEMKA